jgi:hypothetical protein
MKNIKTFNQLPEGYWDFIVQNYPDYDHADEILWNDLLSRYCHNELSDKKDIKFIKEHFEFKNKKQAKQALEKDEMRLYNIAVDNFHKQNTERAYCVVYTKVNAKDGEITLYKDDSQYFSSDEKEAGEAFYNSIRNEVDTYCASFCQVLIDTES